MAKDEAKLEKITITRAVVFDKLPRMVGDVVDVDDNSRNAALVLVSGGKAVAGAVKLGTPAAANKAISDLDTKKA